MGLLEIARTKFAELRKPKQQEQKSVIPADEYVGDTLQNEAPKLHTELGRVVRNYALNLQGGSVPKEALEKATAEQLGTQDDQGNTPLHILMQQSAGSLEAIAAHVATAQQILSKMPPKDLGLKNLRGLTALHVGLSVGNQETSMMLIQRMSPEQLAIQTPNGNNALHYAIQLGYSEVAKVIIEKMDPEDLFVLNNRKKSPIDLVLESAVKDDYRNKSMSLDLINQIIKRSPEDSIKQIGELVQDLLEKHPKLSQDKGWQRLMPEIAGNSIN